MKRRPVYGILLIFILSFNILFLLSNNDTQPELVSTASSNNSLMSSGIYVTNSGDLAVSVDDPTNHTISWTLTDDFAFYVDYLGLYSFTEDSVGSNPSGWTVSEPSGTSISVVSQMNSHNQVVLLDDNSVSEYCRLENTFVPQTSGAIEWWFLMPDVSTPIHFTFISSDFVKNYTINLAISYDYQGIPVNYLAYYDGTSFQTITQLIDNSWNHARITFECGSGNYDNLSQYHFNLYLNGTKYGPLNFAMNESDIAQFQIHTYDFPRQPSEIYIDTVDYSWAPGYYPNRNMDFNVSYTSLVYAVYENDTRMTNWQSWNNSVQIDYNVSGAGLGVGVHNISLMYNDRDGNWYHDDVIVTISSMTQLTIISDPVDFDISGNRKCDVSIKLNNSGNTILTNINVTIEVPAGWSADLHMRTLSQLAPGEVVTITYKLTAPETYEAEEVAIMTINITAEILGTGQLWSDCLSFYVIGIDPGLPIWIWIIIVIGSAAAASTSFVFVRRRRRRIESVAPKYKQISKAFGDLKQRISTEFPGSYTIISMELMDRINQIPGLKDTEKDLLLQDVMHMREKDAEKWIDEFEKTL